MALPLFVAPWGWYDPPHKEKVPTFVILYLRFEPCRERPARLPIPGRAWGSGTHWRLGLSQERHLRARGGDQERYPPVMPPSERHPPFPTLFPMHEILIARNIQTGGIDREGRGCAYVCDARTRGSPADAADLLRRLHPGPIFNTRKPACSSGPARQAPLLYSYCTRANLCPWRRPAATSMQHDVHSNPAVQVHVRAVAVRGAHSKPCITQGSTQGTTGTLPTQLAPVFSRTPLVCIYMQSIILVLVIISAVGQ